MAKKPNPAAAQAVADANARLAESRNEQKALADTVAATDVAPRATDKQVKAAQRKAESKVGKPKHVSDGSDKRVRDAVQDHEQNTKRAGRRQSDPVVNTEPVPEVPAPESATIETEPAPVEQPLIRPEKDASYSGPMLALRQRLKAGVYTKAENGNPSCGDEVATILGKLSPAEVIHACMIAMALDVNPYLHLNIGQQSMNLRNKLRGKLKKNEFGMGVLREAVEEVIAERPAPAKAETDAEE